ncbi:flagellar FliJ family protein [Oscillospiraceae bacterium OttesenSCG-928-F05]|nr:flagellar FliJ family protein [Oscillospiraceae bacterium OttesenSCG-928-F05]
MKRFRFTLQSLLGVKVALEKQRMAELAAVNQRLYALEAELLSMQERYSLHRSRFAAAGEEILSPTDLNIYAVGFEALREQMETQRTRILECEREKEKIQALVVEVMQERKMLEKLKEKQYSAYLDDVRRDDALQVGEFVASTLAMGDTGGDGNGR